MDSFSTVERVSSFTTESERESLLLLREATQYPNARPLFVYADEVIPEVAHSLLFRPAWNIDPSYCVRLPGGSVFGECRTVTDAGILLYDLSAYAGRHRGLPDVVQAEDGSKVAGFSGMEPQYRDCSAAILSPLLACGKNHSHWLFQALPKVQIFREASVDPDFFLVLPTIAEYQRMTLKALGIDESRILVREPEQSMKFRELYASYTGNDISPDLAIYDEVVSKVDKGEKGPEKVYVSRMDARSMRRFVNEEQVIEAAQKHGFHIVTPSELSFEDEVRLFRNARVIAGPVGAGLYNAVFTRPGCLIIAMSEPAYIMDWPLQLTSLRGHSIGYLLGNSFLSMEPTHLGGHNSWVLNPDLFEFAVKQYL